MVWGKRWPIVVLPILFLIFGIGVRQSLPSNISCLCWVDPVLEAIMTYNALIDPFAEAFNNLLLILHMAFILVTTLWCTLMIIFRILSVGRASTGSGESVQSLPPLSPFLTAAPLAMTIGPVTSAAIFGRTFPPLKGYYCVFASSHSSYLCYSRVFAILWPQPFLGIYVKVFRQWHPLSKNEFRSVSDWG